MEVRKSLFCRLLIAGVVSGLLFAGAVTQAIAGAGATAGIVPVVLKGEPESIDPVNAKVTLGTTVAWLNMGPGPVTIRFITKLGLACSAPSNFYGDLLGYYETSPIEAGATASICFIEPGEYEYEVKRLSGAKTETPQEIISRGKVISVAK